MFAYVAQVQASNNGREWQGLDPAEVIQSSLPMWELAGWIAADPGGVDPNTDPSHWRVCVRQVDNAYIGVDQYGNGAMETEGLSAVSA